jgi:hypothetical protein
MVGVGNYTLQNIIGTANSDTATGYAAGSACTTCFNNIMNGTGAGGSVLTTGNGNILQGISTDTAISSTSGALGIGSNVRVGSLDTVVGNNGPHLASDGQHIDAFGNGALGAVTTGLNNGAFGSGAAAAVTTANDVLCGGRQSCGGLVSIGAAAVWGWQGFQVNSGGAIAGLGYQVCKTSTTGNNILCLGTAVGTAGGFTTASDVLLMGTGASTVDDAGNASHYMNINNIITTTGTGTPSTSVTTVAGQLDVAGTMQFGALTGTTCTNSGYIAINDNGGTARKLMVCS